MQNLSFENEFYLHDNKTRFHIDAFELTGLQITGDHRTLADQNLFSVRFSMRLTARWIWDLFVITKVKYLNFFHYRN